MAACAIYAFQCPRRSPSQNPLCHVHVNLYGEYLFFPNVVLFVHVSDDLIACGQSHFGFLGVIVRHRLPIEIIRIGLGDPHSPRSVHAPLPCPHALLHLGPPMKYGQASVDMVASCAP